MQITLDIDDITLLNDAKVFIKRCPRCGTFFLANHKQKVFCDRSDNGKPCSYWARLDYKRERELPKIDRIYHATYTMLRKRVIEASVHEKDEATDQLESYKNAYKTYRKILTDKDMVEWLEQTHEQLKKKKRPTAGTADQCPKPRGERTV